METLVPKQLSTLLQIAVNLKFSNCCTYSNGTINGAVKFMVIPRGTNKWAGKVNGDSQGTNKWVGKVNGDSQGTNKWAGKVNGDS